MINATVTIGDTQYPITFSFKDLTEQQQYDILKQVPEESKSMKELYESEPSKWVVYHKSNNDYNGWKKTSKRDDGILNLKDNSKLIALKDKKIADAVIANPDVEVECKARTNDWCKDSDFFENYQQWHLYQLAKPQYDGKFNGGYIIASQEAYDLLVNLGIKDHVSAFNIKNKNHKPTNLLVYNGVFVGENSNVANREIFKQFYINNGALSWDEPKEETQKPASERW